MNRGLLIVLLMLITWYKGIAQELPPVREQQLEDITGANEIETEDDAYLQAMHQFKRHPINLNAADDDELKELQVLTEQQIENLLMYRQMLGALISIYELQSIPGWDLQSIHKILPYITVASQISTRQELKNRISSGEHTFLFRISQRFEKEIMNSSSGSPVSKYLGSPQRIFLRYRYTYKNKLQFGMVGDKDAGEQFFKGSQRLGFDFYSFHFMARKLGRFETLVLGDFTVNLGQGLIHWQSLAFKKSTEVMAIKRQSPVLRTYNSAGEFYFHRGAGATIKKGKFEATAFFSHRRLSVNMESDTVYNNIYVTSFLSSGYNRTLSEQAGRNKLGQITVGGSVSYKIHRLRIGLNGVHYIFSMPLQKRSEPYNLYSLRGRNWSNWSIDYSYYRKNVYFFGEGAVDKRFHAAILNGVLVTVDPKVDIALLFRTIAKDYQAVSANAFTEGSYPSNESGIYAGISIRPASGWKLDAYFDVFRFPWLKYQVNAPSGGKSFLVQIYHFPNKQVELSTRFRMEDKVGNRMDTGAISTVEKKTSISWRTQLNVKIDRRVSVRGRAEILNIYNARGQNEKGYLFFCDILYDPDLSQYGASFRFQYNETSSYNSRLYAYENDVLFSNSIPAHWGKCFHYYLNLNYDLSTKITCWFRIAHTLPVSRHKVSTDLIEPKIRNKVELKFQLMLVI